MYAGGGFVGGGWVKTGTYWVPEAGRGTPGGTDWFGG